tara:strand:+ start:3522 stop:3989 length:468 start_codon:yes stop_codon:yes gene_type:complete
MLEISNFNSVSKNNFLSLMRSYESNFILLSKLIDLDIVKNKSLGKKFESGLIDSNKKMHFYIESISKHTAIVKFLNNDFDDNLYLDIVKIKIYFDSKQVEILNHKNTNYYDLNTNKDIQIFHNVRLTKWYKSYFLSLWINGCLKKGYSFDSKSEV